MNHLTPRKQACGSQSQMPAQIPAIPKSFVESQQLDLVGFSERQLIRTSSIEIIWPGVVSSHEGRGKGATYE